MDTRHCLFYPSIICIQGAGWGICQDCTHWHQVREVDYCKDRKDFLEDRDKREEVMK